MFDNQYHGYPLNIFEATVYAMLVLVGKGAEISSKILSTTS